MSDTQTTGPTAEADDRGRGLPDIPGLPQVEVDKLVTRARTLYTHLVGGGLADLSRTPSEIVHDGDHTRVYHYLPEVPVDEDELPVLLVPPVNTASSTFDLRRGNSLAEFLMQQGRPTYLVDYGDLSTRVNQDMGLEFWLDQVLPDSIRAVSDSAESLPAAIASRVILRRQRKTIVSGAQ